MPTTKMLNGELSHEVQPAFNKDPTSMSPEFYSPDTEPTNVSLCFEKRLMRNIDLWLVGYYSFVYVF